MRFALIMTLGLIPVVGGCRPAPPAASKVPLYSDLGTFAVPISTTNPSAQQYFNQGMRLTYAFNHAEAIRSFEEAARLDPRCAICHWGKALALGPNINAPMDSTATVAARAAIDTAARLASTASQREQALIAALATRYAAAPSAARGGLDSAYAAAMAGVVAALPNDLEATTLYAEALMNLRPWAYFDTAGKPYPGTDIMLAQLTRVLEQAPDHPGACHYYIHAVEAVTPERAMPCAERLAALMPGAGHLVHMPAHIYIRVGRYADAIEHNQHATHADSTFTVTERPSVTYATLYIPHNYHFLGFAGMLAGNPGIALDAARQTVAKTPADALESLPEYQPILAFEHVMLQKFGRWDALLALPLPNVNLPAGRATAEYARGTAFAAKGQVDSARALADSVAKRVSGLPDGIAKTAGTIAQHSLLGEIAARTGQLAAAEQHFRAAMALEDGLSYMEPPWWIEPTRHALGTTLLKAKKAAEAEAVFRADLARFPKNVWSLYGLWASLDAQGKPEAADAKREMDQARNGTDLAITTAHP